MFGWIKQYRLSNNIIFIEFEEQTGQIEVITDHIINIFAGLETKEHHSFAIEGVKAVHTQFEVKKEDNKIVIQTKELHLEVFDEFKVDIYNSKYELLCADYRGNRKVALTWDEKAKLMAAVEGQAFQEKYFHRKIEIIKILEGDEAFYGLGDKAGYLNKRGYEYEMWNRDIPDPHLETFKSLYKSIPFFITLKTNSVFGIFYDNPYRSYFDMGKESEDYYYFGSDEGNLDYYFIYGNTMADVISGYTYLTGTHPLPQLWTLGYHQSRWSYNNREEVYELAEKFRKHGIPCDGLHLDIDYMDNFKVFTFDDKRFPDIKDMITTLSMKGYKIITIIDPGVKKEAGYAVYDEGVKKDYFAKDSEGNIYENVVWPGDAVFPDFSDETVRHWWGDQHQFLIDHGVSGVWNDMNEPASFRGELPEDVQFSEEGRGAKHNRIHNVYGHLMAKATYNGLKRLTNRRPFVITRACYSGSQKYTTAWTGDNHSIWAHLQMSIPQLCNLGLSGMTFVGTDVGGFGSDCMAELLSRWVQVGCFSPLFRNHTCKGSRLQEPWAFDQKTYEINKKYIKLRYQLLPYLYDLFWSGESTGMPVMRPLVFEYQTDKNTWNLNDQFMVGCSILVAPIVNQGQQVRTLYLPQGEWIDYWTKEVHQGGRYIIKEAPIDMCPMYIKAGSILPNYPEINYVGEKDIQELTLDIYPGRCEYHHFQDNGTDFSYQTGIYNEYCFSLEDQNQLKIDLLHHGYDNVYRSFRLCWKGKVQTLHYTGETMFTSLV
jgi:alpha-glucosidase